jgi:signal transduction histidine kinase
MERRRRAAVASLVAVATLICAFLWADGRERAAVARELDLETRAVAQQLASQAWNALKGHLLSVQQTAQLLARRPRLEESDFHSAVAPALRLNRLCVRMTYADPSFRVRWVHPLQDNRSLVGASLAADARTQEALKRAARSRAPALSPPLSLLDGSAGFIVAAPIFEGERLLGFLTGAFRTIDFVSALATDEFLQRYDLALSGEGIALFETAGITAATDSLATASEQFDVGGTTWKLRVRPRDSVESAFNRHRRYSHAALGVLLALALAVSIYALRRRPAQERRAAAAKAAERAGAAPTTLQEALQSEKLAALGDLVAGVANEINNPLCSILGYTQLMLAESPTPRARERLETMRTDAERISRVVTGLLTFARQHPSNRRLLGLNGIVEKTLEMREHDLKVRRIQVEKQLAPDLPMTLLDFHQIQQLLLSLLANSEQAMEESGRGGTIRITTRATADTIELRVADDGPGVPESIQGRIFEPFFTTRPAGRGTGLGLSVCYGIARDHGGGIRVESRPGQGATFVVTLPVARDKEVSAAPEASTRDAPLERRLRVLVIDKEQGVQNLLFEMLSARGHLVDTAATVSEALRKIGAAPYDLILADMRMPGASARELYAAVVGQAPAQAGRIVFMSSEGTRAQALEFLRDTGSSVLLKPFKFEELEQALSSAVRG